MRLHKCVIACEDWKQCELWSQWTVGEGLVSSSWGLCRLLKHPCTTPGRFPFHLSIYFLCLQGEDGQVGQRGVAGDSVSVLFWLMTLLESIVKLPHNERKKKMNICNTSPHPSSSHCLALQLNWHYFKMAPPPPPPSPPSHTPPTPPSLYSSNS